MNRRCVLHCFLFLACASLALPTSSFSNETPTGPLKIDYTRPVEHQEMEEYEGPSTCEDCHEGVVDQVIRLITHGPRNFVTVENIPGSR